MIHFLSVCKIFRFFYKEILKFITYLWFTERKLWTTILSPVDSSQIDPFTFSLLAVWCCREARFIRMLYQICAHSTWQKLRQNRRKSPICYSTLSVVPTTKLSCLKKMNFCCVQRARSLSPWRRLILSPHLWTCIYSPGRISRPSKINKLLSFLCKSFSTASLSIFET